MWAGTPAAEGHIMRNEGQRASPGRLLVTCGVAGLVLLATLAPMQSCMFASIDPGLFQGIGSRFDTSYAKLAGGAWVVPPMRSSGGFLFEVQSMGYPPFLADVVNLSVLKYALGETTPYSQGGFAIGEWGYSFHHLLGGTPDGSGMPSWGGYPSPPTSRDEAIEYIRRYVVNITEGKPRPWCSFNGHYVYHHYAGEWGFDAIGSEIGENINGYQQSIAFNRGAARQFGLPWFIDVSAWYAGTITDYSIAKPWGAASGATWGHSLSLYRRTYYMTYMAGTSALIAEAGGVNFFEQQLDGDGCFVPSPLGLVGQEFYNFTRRHPDPGVPCTPYALLLDRHHGTYMGDGAPLKAFEHFPYNAGDKMTWQLLEEFFPGSWNLDEERGTLVNTPWGDTCDVLLQDANESVLASYPVIIPSGDLTFSTEEVDRLVQYTREGGALLLNTAYLQQFPAWFVDGMAGQCLAVKDVVNGTLIVYGPAYQVALPFRAAMDALEEVLVPIQVAGDVEFMINRRPSSWVVTLINNDGVTKTPKEEPVVDPACYRTATVTYTRGGPVSVASWISGLPLATGPAGVSVTIEVPPGGVEVIEVSVA